MLGYLFKLSPIYLTLIFSFISFLCNIIGASFVFLFNKLNEKIDSIINYITLGIMLSASIFSMIIPSIKYSSLLNQNVLIVLPLFMLFGYISLYLVSKYLSNNKSNSLYILSMIIHNIPEGILLALAFCNIDKISSLYSGIILSLSISIQNILEGLSTSIYLRCNNSKLVSFKKSIFIGLFEFISSILSILVISKVKYILPSILSLSSGFMIYTVFNSFYSEKKVKDSYNFYFILGFILMMILDLI